MQENPAPVRVSFTVDDRLFAAANVAQQQEPLDIDLQFNAFAPVQTAANNPFLASLNPAFADRLSEIAGRLHPYQEQVMAFMRASQENATRFVENPLGVMVDVCHIPEDLREQILEIQREWPRTAEEV
jgi:hypothetical protein